MCATKADVGQLANPARPKLSDRSIVRQGCEQDLAALQIGCSEPHTVEHHGTVARYCFVFTGASSIPNS